MRPRRTFAFLLVMGLALFGVLSAPASAADKQRVPKPTEPKPRYKPDPPAGGSQKDDSGSSDEGGSSCLADCLGSFFSSLFSSTTPPPAPVALAPWAIGQPGRLLAATEADSVWLWDGPGGADREREIVGRLPSGTPMIVLETHELQTGTWLRVRPADRDEPTGWIAATSLTSPPPAAPPSPTAARRPPTWGMMLTVGGGGPGPADLDQEYADGGFRAELQYLRFLPRNWQSGAGVGWRNFAGHPQFGYASAGSPLVDVPSDSRLRIVDIGIRAGTRHGRDTGFQFSWLLGPTLFHVHEHAEVHVLDSSTLAQVDQYRDQLDRWAGGGDLRFNFGYLSSAGLETGLLVDGYIMAWTGH